MLDAIEQTAGGFLADAFDEGRAVFRVKLGGFGDVRMWRISLPS